MKRRRSQAARVSFDESPPVTLDSTAPTEKRKIWYSRREIAALKRKNERLKRKFHIIDRTTNQRPTSWFYAIRRLHRLCCKLSRLEDVIAEMQPTKYPFLEATLGLERQGIPCISQIVSQRRSQIWADVLAEQMKSVFDEDKDLAASRIRKMSCAKSGPSKMYARMLGEILASTDRDGVVRGGLSKPPVLQKQAAAYQPFKKKARTAQLDRPSSAVQGG